MSWLNTSANTGVCRRERYSSSKPSIRISCAASSAMPSGSGSIPICASCNAAVSHRSSALPTPINRKVLPTLRRRSTQASSSALSSKPKSAKRSIKRCTCPTSAARLSTMASLSKDRCPFNASRACASDPRDGNHSPSRNSCCIATTRLSRDSDSAT